MSRFSKTALKVVLGGGIVGLLSGIAYSALAINHNHDLPPALDGERRTFAVPGAGMQSYYVSRAGVGRPLILIHSINTAASAYEMRPLFDYYRGKRPIYALDLPGFGFSDRADRPYTPDLYTHVIALFLQTQLREKQPADLIALSLGAEFVARAAQINPARVHSLGLISPTGFSGRGGASQNSVPFGNTLHRVLSFPVWGQALYDLLVSERSIRYFLGQSFEGAADEGLIRYALASGHRPGARHAPLHFISGQLFTPNIRETIYEALTLPVLTLYDVDPNIGFAMLPTTLERCPNWRAVRIVPTRGLPHWEKLPETVAALETFWASL
ncbi:MAG TPA: alpha/beta hydrolase [Aggregatilineales bacterium]|nr:alpha/beta hydrolase [Anaerolineales bacterium]HRE49480.1 alpha/beta hydrolase [Aggregatilineales bacterium]